MPRGVILHPARPFFCCLHARFLVAAGGLGHMRVVIIANQWRGPVLCSDQHHRVEQPLRTSRVVARKLPVMALWLNFRALHAHMVFVIDASGEI